MARQGGRVEKVADQIQRELSEIIARELRDPRVGLITLTGVEVSADLRHANVRYSCLDSAHAEEAGEGLRRAAGFLRSRLAKRIRLQVVPELHFFFDESVERGAHMMRLLDGLSKDGGH